MLRARNAALSEWYATAEGYRYRAELDVVLAGGLRRVFGRQALVLQYGDMSLDGIGYASVDHVAHLGPRARDVRADFHALPIESESVALVVVWHAFEFARNRQAVFDEVARVLEPEGCLITVAFRTPRAVPFGLRYVRTSEISDSLLERSLVLDFQRHLGLPSALQEPIEDKPYSERRDAARASVARQGLRLLARPLSKVACLGMRKREMTLIAPKRLATRRAINVPTAAS